MDKNSINSNDVSNVFSNCCSTNSMNVNNIFSNCCSVNSINISALTNNSKLVQLNAEEVEEKPLKFLSIDLPKEDQMSLVNICVKNIKLFKNIDEDVLEFACSYPDFIPAIIKRINEIPLKYIIKAVKDYPNNLVYIPEDFKDLRTVQMEAVKANGFIIRNIEDPDEELQLAAVKNSIVSINSINNPTQSVQEYIIHTVTPTSVYSEIYALASLPIIREIFDDNKKLLEYDDELVHKFLTIFNKNVAETEEKEDILNKPEFPLYSYSVYLNNDNKKIKLYELNDERINRIYKTVKMEIKLSKNSNLRFIDYNAIRDNRVIRFDDYYSPKF